MELVYVRTDKNGTKIFHNWACPRCGGAGESDNWIFTGRICYKCGGTGKRKTPEIVKEYTEEYAAKLEARRQAKADKHNQKQAAEIADQARETLKFRYANFGCGTDGVGYVLRGSTYRIKDQIKANNGKWVYGVWICPVNMQCNGVTSKRIELAGHIGSGSEWWLDGFDLYDEINK